VSSIVEKPKEKPADVSHYKWRQMGNGFESVFAPSAEGSVVYDTINLARQGTSLLHSICRLATHVPDNCLVSDDVEPYSSVTATQDHTLCVKCPADEDEDKIPDNVTMGTGKLVAIGEHAFTDPMRAFKGATLRTYAGGIDQLANNSGYKGKLRHDGRLYRLYCDGVSISGSITQPEVGEDLTKEFFREDGQEEFHVEAMCVSAEGQLVAVWTDDYSGRHLVGLVSADGKDFVCVAELGEARVSSIAIDWRGNLVLLGEWEDGDEGSVPAVVVLDTGAENPANWQELRDTCALPKRESADDDEDDE